MGDFHSYVNPFEAQPYLLWKEIGNELLLRMSSRKRDVGFTHKFKIDKKGKIDNVKPQKFTFSAKEEDFTQVEMIYSY